MEGRTVVTADTEFGGFRNAENFREFFPKTFFGFRWADEFPECDEVIASGSEIPSAEDERVTSFGGAFVCRTDKRFRKRVGDRERHDRKRGGILEFSRGGCRMVEVGPTRPDRASRMFVPIEVIHRQRKRVRIAETVAFQRSGSGKRTGKKPTLPGCEFGPEGFRKVFGGIRFPRFRSDGEFGGSRVDLRSVGVREPPEAKRSIGNRIRTRKPKSARLPFGRNRFRTFELSVNIPQISRGNDEFSNVAELFAFDGFPIGREKEVRLIQRFGICGEIVLKTSGFRNADAGGKAFVSIFQPCKTESRPLGTLDFLQKERSARGRQLEAKRPRFAVRRKESVFFGQGTERGKRGYRIHGPRVGRI